MSIDNIRVWSRAIFGVGLFLMLATVSYADKGGVANSNSDGANDQSADLSIAACLQSATQVCATATKDLSYVTVMCDGDMAKADDLDVGPAALIECEGGGNIGTPVQVKAGRVGVVFVPVACPEDSPCAGLDPILAVVEVEEEDEDDTDTTDEIPL